MVQHARPPHLEVSSPDPNLYRQDFYRWTQHMSVALLSRQWEGLDWENLAEEIESLGKSERRELENRLIVLLMHLLKWQHQANRRSGSWQGTIVEQRFRLRRLLRDSPCLRCELDLNLVECYRDALRQAVSETELDEVAFPETCQWTVTQILSEDFFPDQTGVNSVN